MIKRIHSSLFFVHDMEKTANFYEQLGFQVEKSNDAIRIIFGDFRFAFMDENKAEISNESNAQPKGLGIYTYFEVDNVDAYFKMLTEKGIVVSSEPKDWPWGKREFAVKDPDGYKLIFFSPIIK